MAKNYDKISNNSINNAKLLKLNLYISVLRYLKEGAIRFIEVKTKNDKTDKKNENNQAMAIIFNLEEEKSKQKILRKEKNDTTYLTNFCLSATSLRKSFFISESSAATGSFGIGSFDVVCRFFATTRSSIARFSNTMPDPSNSFPSALSLSAMALDFLLLCLSLLV